MSKRRGEVPSTTADESLSPGARGSRLVSRTSGLGSEHHTPSIATAGYSDRPKGGRSPQIAYSSSDDNSDETANDEEAEAHTMVRMLEDAQGRLQYIGDSANLSFLQLLRMIVETISGPSSFSLDIVRHRITEREFETPPDVDLRGLLPDKETALVLTEAFFTHTHGMVEIFIERIFMRHVEHNYRDLSRLEPKWTCHLYLVLAIGFSLVTPGSGTKEEAVINNLRAKHPNRGEQYYFAAKKMSDPLTGFEDAGFWSIQALTLMALYMLTHSRRNTAYVYTGMAIRLANSLGVHRAEVLVVFQPDEQEERRKVWRSLYVLDLFLSVSLGRPLAISEAESSDDILNTSSVAEHIIGKPETRHVCAAAVEATLRSCHLMGRILREVYSPRKISIRRAQALAVEARLWPKQLQPFLSWRLASRRDVRQAVAILNCNLNYCHSVVLLSRPFYLHLLSNEIQRERLGLDVNAPRQAKEMKKFSDACIDACAHMIAITYTAYMGGYLPRQAPLPNYCVFSAALVIYVNALARPMTYSYENQCMDNSITVLEYCGEGDPQANRAVTILKEFNEVIQKHRGSPSTSVLQQKAQHSTSLPDRPHYAPSQSLQDHTMTQPTFVYSGAPPASAYGPGYVPTQQPPTAESTGLLDGQQWTYSQEQAPGEFPFLGYLDFDNPFLSGIDQSHASSATAEDNLNFDQLWEWPAGSPLPTADLPTTAGQSSQWRYGDRAGNAPPP